ILIVTLTAIGALLLALLSTGAVRGEFHDPVGQATTAPARSPSPVGPLRVVALGDSVPSGYGCPCAGYVADLGTTLRDLTHRPTDVHNDAQGGWTTADVLANLMIEPTRTDLAGADLVLIQVGANDFDTSKIGDQTCFPVASSPCWASTLADLRSGLTQISHDIRMIDPSHEPRILMIGYWNITVAGAVGLAQGPQFVDGSDALTKVVNDTIEAVAAQSHAVYVDAYTGFNGEDGSRDPTEDLLGDGDHPDAEGNAILLQAVLGALTRSGAIAGWTAP
ncbi:MAG: SGNH/GDSL hydrolase family protein, partial [Dermatophilaceae bacterium]